MTIVETINESLPCRTQQIQDLYNLLGSDSDQIPPSIHIYGPPATGKTSIVTTLLYLTGARYGVANCIECYTPRLLFEPLLREIIGSESLPSDFRCDSLMGFVNHLKIAAHEHMFKDYYCAIVLDMCERLSDLGDQYLVAFSRLQELTSLPNLCVIFISEIIPEKFIPEHSYITIPFPQYTKDELLQILMLNRPEKYSEQFYQTYLNLCLSVFLRATRDLNEMRNLTEINFKKYCEPVDNGTLKENDLSGLWKKISPFLKESLFNVYLGTNMRSDNNDLNGITESKTLMTLDLPYYAKYFLIAAFLASYNAPREDKRLFVKHQNKKKKRLVQNKKKENTASDLLGPKSFTLDRLLAIFYAIMEEKASLTANLLAQISTLVELRLLNKLGDVLDKPKYKCAVGFECVDAVAKTLGFNVRKYMVR